MNRFLVCFSWTTPLLCLVLLACAPEPGLDRIVDPDGNALVVYDALKREVWRAR